MKAFILDRYGSKVALRAGELADPDVREDEVLVQVHAAGVNLLDSKTSEWGVQAHLALPRTVRSGSRRGRCRGSCRRTREALQAGRRGLRSTGGSSHRHVRGVHRRPEEDLALKPKKLTMEEAASVPLVGLTAWQALVERGQLKRGQKVFIQAGSGGVGTFAIQLAKHLGATVATTTSTSNIDLVRSLGADVDRGLQEGRF